MSRCNSAARMAIPLALMLVALSVKPTVARVVGVLVGIDQYELRSISSLSGAAADAEGLARALQQHAGATDTDLHVLTTGPDSPVKPSRGHIAAALDWAASACQANDTFIFFFAGHGLMDGDESCILPFDASTAGPNAMAATLISITDLTTMLRSINCANQVVIMDCCRNDPQSTRSDTANSLSSQFARSLRVAVEDMQKTPGRTSSTVLLSCSEGERAYEKPDGSNGVFSSFLIDGLSGKAGRGGEITVDDLCRYVEDNVPRYLRERVGYPPDAVQTPWHRSEGSTTVVLAMPRPPTPVAAQGPETLDVKLRRARSRIDASDYEEAIAELSAAIGMAPNSGEAYRLRAECRYGRKQYALALADAVIAVELAPGDPAGYALLGRIRHQREDEEQAASDFRKAIQLSAAPDASHHEGLGNVLYAMREYEPALEAYTEALGIEPTASRHRSASYCLSELDRHSEALAAAERALELAPDEAASFVCRGSAYAGDGKHAQARADYDRALALAPTSPLTLNLRGNLSYSGGDYDAAIADYSAAIAMSSEKGAFRAALIANRASAYRAKGDHTQALTDCQDAIDADPGYAEAWCVRGRTYADMGEVDLAIASFSRAIELDAKVHYYYEDRAACYFSRKNWDAALSDYCRAIELVPNRAWVYRRRAWVYERKGEHAASISDFGRAIELAPKDDNALAGRGSEYLELEDYDRALKDLNAAIALSSKTAWYYYCRGLVHRDMDNVEAARFDFHKCLGLDPDSAHGKASLGELKALR